MGHFLQDYLFLLLVGAAIGLVPFLLGKFFGKPVWGQLGLICCALGGLFHIGIPALLALGFAGAIFLTKEDLHMSHTGPYSSPKPAGFSRTTPAGGAQAPSALSIQCLSGPLKGRVYRLGTKGVTFGRDGSCTIHLPDGTPGVSRVHCCIRWEQGVPVLVDLNSSYGTFLADGKRLPPQYPTQVAAGTRFYLGNTGNLFQIII